MRSIYIVHTQYNLILAVGMSSKQDDLIVFKDFRITDNLRTRLENRFNKCLFLEGNFPKKELTARQKHEKIKKDNASIETFISQSYDRILVVDDMCIQEMYALKCAYRKNNSVEMAWLEDGANAYFDNGVISGGMGATPVKRFVRKVFFSIYYGLFGFYDLASCMGGHKRLTTVYATFPQNIRRELESKRLCDVTIEQFNEGMNVMYGGDSFPFERGCVLVAMDKLDVYGDKFQIVNEKITEIVEAAKRRGNKVYYKYHPRETDSLPSLSRCDELDRTVALECYLTNSITKNMTVIGIKSTALQTAKKMGYKVVSFISEVEDDAQEIVRFYKSIGVEFKWD